MQRLHVVIHESIARRAPALQHHDVTDAHDQQPIAAVVVDAPAGYAEHATQPEHASERLAEIVLQRRDVALDGCLALTVDNEAIVERLLKRAEIEGRADDNEETIRERMREYDSKTAPLLEFYKRRDLLLEVDGMGTIEEVSERIAEALS